MIGKTISHYKILEKLGEGGMASVYKAMDLKLKREVAIKFLSKRLTSDQKAKDRFMHEAQAASAVNHLNIATVYEIDEVENECYICQEYVEGKSLKRLIQEKPLSWKDFLDISIQIAEGLNAAHEKGIVHRDIKSDNVMVTPEGVVKITDFGLAKLKDFTTLTDNGTVLGTLEYMSPEQVQGLKIDYRSDIFSLGVVMYEMVTGRMPFKGDYQAVLVYSIINETPEPLARYKSDVPDELQRIVTKALEKNVEARYQHLDELAADLKRLKQDQTHLFKQRTDVRVGEEGPYRPSLAVMYLDNMSGKKEDDYFVAGMTEDIITDLCSIEGIKVLSRSDVLPFRGKEINIKEIGKKLSVDYVLEGSVRKADHELRINAQLIKAADGFHIWAERFDEKLTNIFELQATVAQKIARSLKVKLTPSELLQIEKKPTFSIQAYDFYLQGRDYYWRLGKTDIEHSIKMYEQALKIDPDYALAYAGLADAYVYKYEAYYERSVSMLDQAEKASKKALSIDPDLPEAHRSSGRVYMFKKMTEKAIEELKEAAELRPNFYEALRTLGWLYEESRMFDEAIKWAQRALEIRPTDKESFLLLGITYFDQRLYDSALDAFHKALEVAPDYATAQYYLGSTFSKQGKFDLALEKYLKCIEAGCDPNVCIDLGWVYLYKKDYQNSLKCFQKSISLGHFDFQAYYLSGLVNRLIKKTKEAEKYYKKSAHLCSEKLKSDPENPYLHSTLGLAFLSVKETEKGEKEIKTSLKFAPEDGAIIFDAARFYALKNDEKKALALLKKALDLPLSPSKAEARLDPHLKSLQSNAGFTKLMS
jgi:serine/threonine protein kinase/Tfp pilus assembly protein PilF